jgi:penicillin-binding protein 1C
VWIGRPDGTPSPGQYGAVTALPLLFQIADMLPQRGGRTHAAQPTSVRSTDICWPLGGSVATTPAPLCRQRRTAWVLDDAIPPTFAERDLGAWSFGLLTLRVNQRGQRLSGACHAAHEQTIRIARWPVLATPWLSIDDRRAATLPPLAPGCAADSLDVASPIRIVGLNPGVVLRRAPNSDHPLRVSLNALGTQAPVQWLLNGRLQGSSVGATPILLTLPQAGDYRITALADDGAFATLALHVAG